MKKISFRILLFFCIFLFATVATCEPTSKKQNTFQETKNDFTMEDFEDVVSMVERNYIDKTIDVNRAFADASVFAFQTLPHPLFIYPEAYYNEREKYEEKEDIYPGTTFKLASTDCFLIFDPDYKKVEEIRKNKLKQEANKPKISNDELKKIVEREQAKKQILSSRWEQCKFSKKDFDRTIAFISQNLSKYKTPALKDVFAETENIEEEDEKSKKEEFSIKDVYLAAANGYLNSLDPHSSVFLRKDWEDSMEKIEDSSFEGIGAMLSGGGSREVIVENPLEDYPAVKAGVRAGDVILAVDHKSTKNISLDKVVKRIKGKKGTKVTLSIKRKGFAKPFEIQIKRGTITIRNVSKRLIKDNESIAYIKLTGFVKSSYQEIRAAYQDLEKEASQKGIKLKAVILDLRNNAGGYLELAVDISDMFLKKKSLIVTTRSQNEPDRDYEARSDELINLPLVILINAKSASASEIVASALKHHGRALLLGERTFGKATVQKLMDLPRNSKYLLKITQSRYYSPSGTTIQVVGVDPDIEVSAEEDGSFPFQYREENMWHHLPKIPNETKHKQYFNIQKLKDYVAQNGKAEEYFREHKNDPIKPDYQLIRSLDYIDAMLTVGK